MRILVDLGHPAHFHLLKHAIVHLRRDNDVVVVARQKDCLPDLLAQENIPFHLVPRRGLGLAALGGEALRALALGLRLAWRKPFDLLIGNSIVIGPLARMTGGISVVFNEDDCRAVPLQAFLAYRPAHYVVTPRCLKFENYGLKHLTYGGYEEMAYLHPNRFRPDPSVRGELGLGDGERFFVVRLVASSPTTTSGRRASATPRRARSSTAWPARARSSSAPSPASTTTSAPSSCPRRLRGSRTCWRRPTWSSATARPSPPRPRSWARPPCDATRLSGGWRTWKNWSTATA